MFKPVLSPAQPEVRTISREGRLLLPAGERETGSEERIKGKKSRWEGQKCGVKY